LIQEKLGVKNMPQNLAPSSVLEALLAAYTAWMTFAATLNQDFQIKVNHKDLHVLVAQKAVTTPPTSAVRPDWVPL
jgi:hypothetical protein